MTLRCPGCGAPSRTGSARCEYCEARLATVGCPSCFALLFEGSAYCPHCGAAQSRGEPMDARQVRCPACRGAMRWITVGDLDLLECEACDGTWIEADAFERLCASRESQAAVLHGDPARRRAPSARSRPLSPVSALRHDDEPHELRAPLGDGRRRLPRARDVPRPRRAAPGRSIHSRRRAGSRAPGGDRGTSRGAAAAAVSATTSGLPRPRGGFAWDERWFRDFMKALVEKR